MTERRTERRVITALFVDVVGSTELQVRIGPERTKRALDRAFADLRAEVEAERGIVERTIGDAIFAIFGAPVAHADDPLRALRAAEACVRWAGSTRSSPIPFAVRVGVETGEALIDLSSNVEQQQVGICVNTAARLQHLAEPGGVLVGPVCRDAAADGAELEDAGEHELKGLGSVRVWRLISTGGLPPEELPFVGRGAELATLAEAYERSRAGRGVVALVLGPPGQGKSRLVSELLATAAAGAQVLVARCRPQGEPGAAEPLGHLGLTMDPALGSLPAEERRDEIASAWRHHLADIAGERPLVLSIDDLHLADPELVRVLDRVASSAGAAILICATARPEMLERSGLRPSEDRVVVELDPLAPEAATDLARHAGAASADAARRGGGNPLFTIELARTRRGGGDLPVTLHAAIGARLDELALPERDLLQRASIVGEAFTSDDAALLSGRDVAEVARSITQLAERRYVTRSEVRYRFDHALLREVAYQRLPTAERMALHARYARSGVDPLEVEALAHQWWQAVAPPDAEWVWEDAAEVAAMRREALAAALAAGRRQAARFAHASAVESLEHAVALAGDPLERAAAERALADAHKAEVASDDAWLHYLRARDALVGAGAPVPADLYAALLELPTKWRGGFREPPEDEAVLALIDQGLAAASRSGDVASRVSMLLDRAYVDWRRHSRLESTADLDEAFRLVRDAGFPPSSVDTLQRVALLRAYGAEDLQSAGEAFAIIDRLIAAGARAGDEDSHFRQRISFALRRGDLARSRELADEFLSANERRGPHLLSHALASRIQVAEAEGDDGLAIAIAERARRLAEEHPATQFCPQGLGSCALLGTYVLAARGRRDEAEGMLEVARRWRGFMTDDRHHLLAYALLGDATTVERLADETAFAGMPDVAAFALSAIGRWDLLGPALARLDELAARGWLTLEAAATAMREEAAAASGGPPPTHATLLKLGYKGWSRHIAHQRARAAAPLAALDSHAT